MGPWTKLTTVIAAVVCCSSIPLSASIAHAEDTEDTPESSEALTSENDDINIEPSRDDAERRLRSVDRDWNRRGYGGCYGYCDNLRDDCMRRHFRGYGEWRGRRGNRWDRRYGWSDAYRRCERRFDFCIDVCRDSRWRNR